MRTSWHSRRPRRATATGSTWQGAAPTSCGGGCTMASSTSTRRRCPSHWATSSPSAMPLPLTHLPPSGSGCWCGMVSHTQHCSKSQSIDAGNIGSLIGVWFSTSYTSLNGIEATVSSWQHPQHMFTIHTIVMHDRSLLTSLSWICVPEVSTGQAQGGLLCACRGPTTGRV